MTRKASASPPCGLLRQLRHVPRPRRDDRGRRRARARSAAREGAPRGRRRRGGDREPGRPPSRWRSSGSARPDDATLRAASRAGIADRRRHRGREPSLRARHEPRPRARRDAGCRCRRSRRRSRACSAPAGASLAARLPVLRPAVVRARSHGGRDAAHALIGAARFVPGRRPADADAEPGAARRPDRARLGTQGDPEALWPELAAVAGAGLAARQLARRLDSAPGAGLAASGARRIRRHRGRRRGAPPPLRARARSATSDPGPRLSTNRKEDPGWP